MTSTPPPDDPARGAWLLMNDLVLAHGRRREVTDALGLSFGRVRALRRLAGRPLSMRELANALGVDPPNATGLVDELESLGLARRRPHPTDGRARVVEATRRGKAAARRADEILGTPPPGFSALDGRDAATLRRILERVVRP